MLGAVRIYAASAGRLASSRCRSTIPLNRAVPRIFAAKTINHTTVWRASFHQSTELRQSEGATAAVVEETDGEPAVDQGPVTRFKELETRGIVHKNVTDTIINRMRMKEMTEVQTRTINEALSGADMYVLTMDHWAATNGKQHSTS